MAVSIQRYWCWTKSSSCCISLLLDPLVSEFRQLLQGTLTNNEIRCQENRFDCSHLGLLRLQEFLSPVNNFTVFIRCKGGMHKAWQLCMCLYVCLFKLRYVSSKCVGLGGQAFGEECVCPLEKLYPSVVWTIYVCEITDYKVKWHLRCLPCNAKRSDFLTSSNTSQLQQPIRARV